MHTYKDYGQDPVGIKEQVIKSCRYLLLPVVRFVLRHDPGGAIAFAPPLALAGVGWRVIAYDMSDPSQPAEIARSAQLALCHRPFRPARS